jgi:hypothetical protein
MRLCVYSVRDGVKPQRTIARLLVLNVLLQPSARWRHLLSQLFGDERIISWSTFTASMSLTYASPAASYAMKGVCTLHCVAGAEVDARKNLTAKGLAN